MFKYSKKLKNPSFAIILQYGNQNQYPVEIIKDLKVSFQG